jgi:acyl-CoA thioesterase-1
MHQAPGVSRPLWMRTLPTGAVRRSPVEIVANAASYVTRTPVADRSGLRTGQRWRVLNLSTSGALIRDVLGGQLPQVPATATLVTCGIGVNDIFYSAPTRVLRDLRTLVGAVPDGTVLLDLPLPAGMWGILGRLSLPYVARVNRVIHRTAAARGLPVAEVSAHFRPPWPGKFAADCFHPSQAGYRDWSGALLAALP